MTKRILTAALGLVVLSSLSACYLATAPMRHETATRLSSAAHMIERHVEANGFDITVFERVHKKGGHARLYIEGDGPVWLNGEQQVYEPLVSSNPTPSNPVALHLATHDAGDNVFVVNRPCQYLGGHRPDEQKGCPSNLWQQDRYGPEVIDTVNKTIDTLKRHHNITSFDLVGFQGGGVIALALTLHREDIGSVRTIAAPLDLNILTTRFHVPPLSGSANPVEFAARVAQVPQIHFFGHMEEEIPYKQMANSYAAAADNDTRCMQFQEIKRASDDKGFVRIWPDLLKAPIVCHP
jgi:hypothetical protein